MSDPHRLAELCDSAEQKGYEAYEEGAWEIDNPYARGSTMGRAWSQGWNRAANQYATA